MKLTEPQLATIRATEDDIVLAIVTGVIPFLRKRGVILDLGEARGSDVDVWPGPPRGFGRERRALPGLS